MSSIVILVYIALAVWLGISPFSVLKTVVWNDFDIVGSVVINLIYMEVSTLNVHVLNVILHFLLCFDVVLLSYFGSYCFKWCWVGLQCLLLNFIHVSVDLYGNLLDTVVIIFLHLQGCMVKIKILLARLFLSLYITLHGFWVIGLNLVAWVQIAFMIVHNSAFQLLNIWGLVKS